MANKFYGWKMDLGSRPYKAALAWQERMVAYRQHGTVRDTLFYLTHPDVFTIGKNTPEKGIPKVKDIECFHISRGGGVTYHGPGQLVVYPIFDLARRGKDLHKFIHDIEEGIIQSLGTFGIKCRRYEEHTGVWVKRKKIASIGIAVKRWISYHGAAINLTTDLSKFNSINPCGFDPKVMTSAKEELGREIPMENFMERLSEVYSMIFDTAFYELDMEELIEIISLEESSQSL